MPRQIQNLDLKLINSPYVTPFHVCLSTVALLSAVSSGLIYLNKYCSLPSLSSSSIHVVYVDLYLSLYKFRNLILVIGWSPSSLFYRRIWTCQKQIPLQLHATHEHLTWLGDVLKQCTVPESTLTMKPFIWQRKQYLCTYERYINLCQVSHLNEFGSESDFIFLGGCFWWDYSSEHDRSSYIITVTSRRVTNCGGDCRRNHQWEVVQRAAKKRSPNRPNMAREKNLVAGVWSWERMQLFDTTMWVIWIRWLEQWTPLVSEYKTCLSTLTTCEWAPQWICNLRFLYRNADFN